MRSPLPYSSREGRSAQILGARYRFEVRRIHAGRVAAQVIHFEPVRYRAYLQLVSDAMRQGHPVTGARAADPAVAKLAPIAHPEPAMRRDIAQHLGVEALLKRPDSSWLRDAHRLWPFDAWGDWMHRTKRHTLGSFFRIQALAASARPLALVPRELSNSLRQSAPVAQFLCQIAIAERRGLRRSRSTFSATPCSEATVAPLAVETAVLSMWKRRSGYAALAALSGLARLWLHADPPFGMPAPGVCSTRGRLLTRFYPAGGVL